MNFLSVTTRVTVRLAHSLVRTKTAEMQRYWVSTLQAKWKSILGTEKPRMDIGVLFRASKK